MAMPWVPDRREIIWINCSPQDDTEIKGLHPLLVLSPHSFNERTGIVIGLPMTTAESSDTNPFAVKVSGPRGIVSYILCHQPKSFDWRARGAKPHPWKQATPEVFSSACGVLNQVIAI
jgi:mRNA interferase MazF